ncbi:MAG: helix-turn-helix domain-containing protein [Candidatus Planktophila sp.]
MNTPTTHSISARLRSIRLGRSLSLREVQLQSKGALPAVVLGSYERGDRTLSISKAIQIAAFYEVPLSYLLSEPDQNSGARIPIVIDLRRLRALVTDKSQMVEDCEQLRTLITFISGIVRKRNDWDGEVLSLRREDLDVVAITVGSHTDFLVNLLQKNKLLIQLDR